MAAPDFSIKTGDTASSIYGNLQNSGGTSIDILGAGIRFKMGPIAGGTLSVADAATNAQNGVGSDGTMGDVRFDWPAGGVGTVGLYLAEWEVTYASGTIETFPNDGYVTVLVTGDL